MGYNLYDATQPQQVVALNKVLAALKPGTMMLLGLTLPDTDTQTAMVGVTPDGLWLSVGMAGFKYDGQDHAISILKGLIGAAAYHSGALTYAVDSSKTHVLF